MKKLMFLGLVAFGLSLMSFTSNSNELKRKPPVLVTYECPNGYTFQYYELEGYSEADYADMISSVCDD